MYRLSALRTTSVTVRPSASALALAGSYTSSGMRNGRVGVFATSDGPRAELLRAGCLGERAVGDLDQVVNLRRLGLRGARDLAPDAGRQAVADGAVAGDEDGCPGLCHAFTVDTLVDTVKLSAHDLLGGQR
jgi:hypothetical protein